jgi:hypothetical protein
MVGVRFRQRVRSSWLSGLFRWRARTSWHTESDCDRNACANSQPLPNSRAAHHSAAVMWIGFSKKCQSGSDRCRRRLYIRRQSRPRIATACQGVAAAIVPDRIGKEGRTCVSARIPLRETFYAKRNFQVLRVVDLCHALRIHECVFGCSTRDGAGPARGYHQLCTSRREGRAKRSYCVHHADGVSHTGAISVLR